MKAVFLVSFFLLFCVCSLGQSVIISNISYCVQNGFFVRGARYLIKNESADDIILFFTEDEVSEDSIIQQLKRKLLRPYGDFQLSMLEWEANLQIEDTCSFIPELFVKILNADEIFEIIVISDSEEPGFDLCKHMLMCNESDLSQIGLSNFIRHLDYYNFGYQYSYIVINESVLRIFSSGSTTS